MYCTTCLVPCLETACYANRLCAMVIVTIEAMLLPLSMPTHTLLFALTLPFHRYANQHLFPLYDRPLTIVGEIGTSLTWEYQTM